MNRIYKVIRGKAGENTVGVYEVTEKRKKNTTMNRKRNVVLGLAVATVAVMLNFSYCNPGNAAAQNALSQNPETTRTVKGMPAKSFRLKDQYGRTHTLVDYKGKVILVVFEATWCPDCIKQMPAIQNIYERFKREGRDEVVVLGVVSPTYKKASTETDIKTFLIEKGQTYPVLFDLKNKMFDSYGIGLIPTNYVIDRDGTVAEIAIDTTSEEKLEQLIRQTLETPKM